MIFLLFCFCHSSCHFLIYFFSIFSHIDPYYFMSYNRFPHRALLLYFWPADLKGWVSKYLSILFPFISKTRVYWCHCLLLMYVADWAPEKDDLFLPPSLPSSLPSPSPRSQQLPHGSQQEDPFWLPLPLKKKKAEHLQSWPEGGLALSPETTLPPSWDKTYP